MITELQLFSFGKFRDRNFPLARLTLFSGPNEAGKTTIFDGLFDALCRPKANGTPGRMLLERYGPSRAVELKWDSQPYNLSETDFLDLCSISTLRQPPRFASSGGWMSTIKSQLFAGGINPGVILSDLEDQASTNGRRKHMRELNELSRRRDSIQAERDELERVRSQSLQELAQARTAAARVEELQARATELRQQQRSEEQQAEQYQLIRERERLQEALSNAAQAQTLRARIESTYLPDDTGLTQLRELSSRIADAEQELHTLQRLRLDREIEINELQSRLQRLESQLTSSGERAALAARLLRQLQQMRPPHSTGIAHQAQIGRLSRIAAAAAVVAALWTATPLLLPVPWPLSLGSGIPLVAASVSAALYAGLRTGIIRRSRNSYTSDLQDIQEEIRLTLGDINTELPDITAEPEAAIRKITDALEEHIRKPEMLRANVALERERLEGMDARLRETREVGTRTSSQLHSTRGERARLLADYSADSLTELENRSDSLARDQKQFETVSERLDDIAKAYEIGNVELLHSELGRRLDALSPKIRVDPPSEAERRAQTHRLDQINRELGEIGNRLTELHMDQQRHQAAYNSRFSSLPQEFLRVERELEHVSREIRENTLNRESAELAAQIFRELVADSSDQLTQLSDQVARWFGDILQLDRQIAFHGFGEKQVQVEDAGGTMRQVDHLSSGTRDAFYLAARLALIAESRLDPGLVILDDPCITLDPQRTGQSMAVLARFLETTEHQVIYLSKDPLTDSYIRDVLPDTAAYREHELTATRP